MTYRGHIQGGAVVLEKPVKLPDGTQVDVAIHQPMKTPQASTLLERFSDLVGRCPDLPEDMAANHDHYLHGQEKR